METKTKAILAIAALFLASAGVTAALVATGVVNLDAGDSEPAPEERAAESGGSEGKSSASSQGEKRNRKLKAQDLSGLDTTGATDSDVKEILATLNNYKKENADLGADGLEIKEVEKDVYKVKDTATGEEYDLVKGMTSWKFGRNYDYVAEGEGTSIDPEEQRRAIEAEREAKQGAEESRTTTPTHK